MKKPRRIIIVVYNGFEILDLSGPASVFSTSSDLSAKANYIVTAVSNKVGLISSDAGIEIRCQSIHDIKVTKRDTILVVGAKEQALQYAGNDLTLISWLSKQAGKALRFGSICSGTYLLGVAGLLDNRKVTTHWAACEKLKIQFPTTKFNSEALYIQDQNLWTSAGVASGIDMALAIIGKDFGATLKSKTAKWLVIYSHRPGYQSQFSQLLKAQTSSEQFAELISWINNNLERKLTVECLAAKANMCERSFYRKFSADIGITPAKYVETSRLNLAKELIETGLSLKQIPSKIGFQTGSGFRQAFEKKFGITPSTYRNLHST